GWSLLFPDARFVHPGVGAVAAIICGANFILAFMFLPESLPIDRRAGVSTRRFATLHQIRDTLVHPAIGPLIILFFMITFAFSNLEMSFVLYADRVLGLDFDTDRGMIIIFGLFLYIGLVIALVQGWFIRKAVKF